MKIGVKITVLFLVAVLLVGACMLFFMQKKQGIFQRYVFEKAQSCHRLFHLLEEHELQKLATALDVLDQNQGIKEIYLKQDRDKLYEACIGLFVRLKQKYKITHFYFIKPDGTCFLRVHKKDMYGDIIDRYTLIKSKQTQDLALGLELGKTAFALRAVKPYYRDNKLIGYIELGQETDQILEYFKGLYPENEFFIVSPKHLIDKEKFLMVKKIKQQRNNWEDEKKYVVLSSTFNDEKTKLSDIAELEKAEPVSREIKIMRSPIKVKTKDYIICLTGLVDSSKAHVGELMMMLDVTEYMQTLNKQKAFAAAVVVLLCLLLAGIGFMVIKSIAIPVSRLSKAAKEIAKGNLNVYSDIRSNDEIGQLAHDFNTMVKGFQENTTSIARLNKEIQERNKVEKALLKESSKAQRYFNQAAAMFVVLDAQGNIEMLNNKACEILQTTLDDVKGRNWFDTFIPSTIRPQVKNDFNRLIKGDLKGVENYTNDIISAKNKRKTISWTNSLTKDEQENVIGVFSSGVDISDQLEVSKEKELSEAKYKKLAKELEQGQAATLNILEDLQEAKEVMEISRQNFLNIVEKSTDSVVIVDNKKIVRFVNSSAMDLFGKGQSMVGHLFELEIEKEDVKEVTISQKSGQCRIAEIRAVDTEWEEQPMMLILLHDVTERKKAEDSLRLAAHEWRVTFDSIGDGLSLLDLDCRIVRCNKALSEFLEKPYSQIIGADAHQMIIGQDEGGECPIHKTLETGKRSSRIIKSKDRWVTVSVDPLLNENKQLVGLVHSVADITEQKQIEFKLREYTDYVENIIETAQAIIIGFNNSLEIQSFNAFAEKTLGYTRQEVIGRNLVDLFITGENREEMLEVLNNCLEGDRVKGYEVPVVAKDKKELIISWDSSELRDAQDNIIGIVAMGYDVSQRKEIEKVQRLAQLGTLVSHMAHEVNNPLMVISGRAQLSLMEEIENREVKENLKIVMKECQRAKDIIQRLLRFSRPSKGEVKETDINESLKEVVGLIEHQFSLSDVHMVKDYAPDLPHVMVDEKQVHEVFMNLLTNACDAIGSGGSITIKTVRDGENVKITFKDTGPGITKEVLDKIFDPFFTTKKKGTGLGLSICYSIIKAHNGELSFQSAPGKGTTATIILPIIQEKQDA
jgi:PAS domain S-box-containing protein